MDDYAHYIQKRKWFCQCGLSQQRDDEGSRQIYNLDYLWVYIVCGRLLEHPQYSSKKLCVFFVLILSYF